MDLKALGVLTLAVLLTFGVTRWLFPRTETVQLPGETEVDTVTLEVVRDRWRTRVETRWRDRVTTDTLVVADTITETVPVYIPVLRGRWYLDSASIATERGDTSFYALTWLEGDSTGIQRAERVESHITLGPVTQIATDAQGLHVDYGEFRSCNPALGGFDLPFGLDAGPGGACGIDTDGQVNCVVGFTVN